MEAKELVGKWIVSEVLTDELNAPAGTVFKVVGYVQDTNLLIVDAGRLGWTWLNPEDIVFERSETYKYARMSYISKIFLTI